MRALASKVFDLILPSRCCLCGRYGAESGLCPACRKRLGSGVATGDVLALGGYWGHLDASVRALKFSGRREVAQPLAQLLADGVRTAGWRPAIVVPVPLHAARLAERGYNQAELLARPLAAAAGSAYAPVLARTRNTVHQPGSSRAQRARNVKGAFRVEGALNGEELLLVDDVFTTGATARECAQVLRAAGAGRVRVAVVARA